MTLDKNKGGREKTKDGGGQFWDKIYDDNNACYYYQNKETSEATWEKPESFKDGED